MKQKTRFLIYILVAVAFVILGSIAIINNHQADKPASAQEHIDLGRIYLNDLSYEKAVLEFTEAINIEPLNADAYLGLAEAYVGTGDTEKAVEILEKGYDKTGDERLKDMLEELQPIDIEETTAVTTAETIITTTEETTTVSTAAMAIVPDLSGLTEAEAVAACEAAGLRYSVSYDYSDEVEKGYVVNQVVPANSSVVEGISVPFTVSEGVKVVTTVATMVETTVSTTVETMISDVTTSPKIETTNKIESIEEFVYIGGKKHSTLETSLYFRGDSFTDEDMKSLSKMTNLRILQLQRQHISDISELKYLKNLRSLDLSSNQINDISVLSELTELTELILTNNEISDISAISNLNKLTRLELAINQIENIDSLSTLTNLQFLFLGGNKISNLQPISKLVNLSQLGLENNKIDDITAICNLTNLEAIDLSNNQIIDISSISKLINLTSLNLGSNQINNINALENLKKIHSLWLQNNPIKDINVLKKLNNLSILLNLSKTEINENDIDVLKKALPDCRIYY